MRDNNRQDGTLTRSTRRFFLSPAAEVAGVCLLVGFPLILVACLMLWPSWPDILPGGDGAVLELAAWHAPQEIQLAGLPSPRLGFCHPGPMYVYMLCPLYWLMGCKYVGLTLTAVLISLAATVGSLLVIWRCAGRTGLIWSALLITLYINMQGMACLAGVWTASVTIMPFVFGLFLFAAVATGRPGYLPAAVLVSSFLVQTHLVYAPALATLALSSLVFCCLPRLRKWFGIRAPGSGNLARMLLICVVLLALLWAPPVIEQISHTPGNLWEIAGFVGKHEVCHSWGEVLPTWSKALADFPLSFVGQGGAMQWHPWTETLRWYRLEVVLSTTSDWTDVRFQDFSYHLFVGGLGAEDKTPAQLNARPRTTEPLAIHPEDSDRTKAATLYVGLPDERDLQLLVTQGHIGATKLTIRRRDEVLLDAFDSIKEPRDRTNARTFTIPRYKILGKDEPAQEASAGAWYRLEAAFLRGLISGIIAVGQVLLVPVTYCLARRGGRDFEVVLCLLVVALLGVSAVSIRRMPGLIDPYLVWWVTSLSLLILVAAGGALLGWLGRLLRIEPGSTRHRIVVVAALAALVFGCAMNVKQALDEVPQMQRGLFDPGNIIEPLLLEPSRDFLQRQKVRRYLLRIEDRDLWPSAAGLVLQWTKSGLPPVLDPEWASVIAPQHVVREDVQGILYLCRPESGKSFRQRSGMRLVAESPERLLFWSPSSARGNSP